SEGTARTAEEIGDLLFTIASLARQLGIEPESALRKANEKFSARFEQVEQALEARGSSVHDASLEEMEAEWQRLKARGL
ncbi:MAG: nucleoside triphosphate pyrophosphohydrolase, partial [Acidobacteriota bacterium]|nr:nucleoside triphosphate pyrophosphohydrolase [Acidobacteriota bacterium]